MVSNWHSSLGIVIISALVATGCSNLPGNKESQGAVIGGASGAAVGAAIGGEDNRLLGAILGGLIGAGGGYVIGANMDKITGKDKESAEVAARKAQTSPATPDDVKNSRTADLNSDGFVTLDEVIAMDEAGLSEDEMFSRLEATDQIFELSADQRQYLRDKGVSERIIQDMITINREQREQLLKQRS